MLHWWPFLAANSYWLSVPTIYVQNSVSFTNSFSQIIFINSRSPIFFYKFNITNSFSRINLRIRKSSKKFVRIRTTSFWFVFAKSVLCCERPVLYIGFSFSILQSFGKQGKDIEKLINSVIGSATTCSPSLRNFPARLSIPAVLVGFISLKSFWMAATFIGLNEKVFPLSFSAI